MSTQLDVAVAVRQMVIASAARVPEPTRLDRLDLEWPSFGPTRPELGPHNEGLVVRLRPEQPPRRGRGRLIGIAAVIVVLLTIGIAVAVRFAASSSPHHKPVATHPDRPEVDPLIGRIDYPAPAEGTSGSHAVGTLRLTVTEKDHRLCTSVTVAGHPDDESSICSVPEQHGQAPLIEASHSFFLGRTMVYGFIAPQVSQLVLRVAGNPVGTEIVPFSFGGIPVRRYFLEPLSADIHGSLSAYDSQGRLIDKIRLPRMR
jgi:uncharacterized protein with FMN-binding domain